MTSVPEKNDASGSLRGAGEGKPSGDGRSAARDERRVAGTSGGLFGTSGFGPYVVVALILLAVATINAVSDLHDQRQLGRTTAEWVPFVLEYSSIAALLALTPFVAWLIRSAPPRRPWLRFAAVHVAATAPFSLAHVVLMVGLREAAWAAAGGDYRFDWSAGELVYEWRKDLLAYLLIAMVFAVRRRPEPASEVAAEDEAALVQVELADGRKTAKAPLARLVAAYAAGNYVELVFDEGPRRLVRTTLAAAAEALAPHGFVRTHRSWLVRVERVAGLEPTGAGDWSARLDGGVEAPVSRRHPQALARLRERCGEGR